MDVAGVQDVSRQKRGTAVLWLCAMLARALAWWLRVSEQLCCPLLAPARALACRLHDGVRSRQHNGVFCLDDEGAMHAELLLVVRLCPCLLVSVYASAAAGVLSATCCIEMLLRSSHRLLQGT